MKSNRARWFLTAAILIAGGGAWPQAGGPGGPPPPPDVAYVTVTRQTVPVSFEYVGVTEASKVVEVRARVRGFLETREFEEGALVEAGRRLFTIDARPFAADLEVAQARVEQAETRLQLARQEVKRLESVTVPGAIAESDLDRQLAEESNAAAAVRLAKAELAKAQLELDYTTVEAPLTGYIGKALKEIGSLVDEGQNSLLAIMQQVDPIYVSFQMSERDFLSWRGDLARGALTAEGGTEPYLEITLLDGSRYAERGTIDFESTAVAVGTGTVELRGTFSNPDRRLKPGQFVNVSMRGWARPDTVAIPQRAVSQSPQGAYVYVVDAANQAEFRVVQPGGWHGQSWIIEEGLEAGERVIVEGLVKVQPGIVVQPAPFEGAPPAEAAK